LTYFLDTFDVVDECDVVTNKKGLLDIRVVILQEGGLMDED